MKTVNGWAVPDRDTYLAPFLKKENGFQLDHLEHAILHCHDTRMAVDGGANIGTWTCSMAARFQHVWAFEPALDTFKCLAVNVRGGKAREAADRGHLITVRAEALSERDGWAEVQRDDTRKGNTGSDYISIWKGQGKPLFVHADRLVRIRRLDDFGLNCLDFLKLDLEGHEYFALEGAEKTVREYMPVIIMETTPKGFAPDRYGIADDRATKLLEAWGYEMVEYLRPDSIFVPK